MNNKKEFLELSVALAAIINKEKQIWDDFDRSRIDVKKASKMSDEYQEKKAEILAQFIKKLLVEALGNQTNIGKEIFEKELRFELFISPVLLSMKRDSVNSNITSFEFKTENGNKKVVQDIQIVLNDNPIKLGIAISFVEIIDEEFFTVTKPGQQLLVEAKLE